jgi:hypothetical protein
LETGFREDVVWKEAGEKSSAASSEGELLLQNEGEIVWRIVCRGEWSERRKAFRIRYF